MTPASLYHLVQLALLAPSALPVTFILSLSHLLFLSLCRVAMVSVDVYCILVGALGGSIFGYSTGIIGGISTPLICQWFPSPDQVVNDVNKCGMAGHELNSTQSFYQGLLTACILVGAFAGAFVGPWVANTWGRRMGCFVAGMVAVVTSVGLGLVGGFWPIIAIRSLQGIAVGMSSTVCPLYVSEMASEERKGKLGSVFQVFICGSILVAELTSYAYNMNNNNLLPDWNWHVQFGLCIIPGLLLVVLSRIMPESTAFKAAAMSSMHDNEDESMSGGSQWGTLFSAAGFRWVGVAIILSVANQLTGINGIVFYAPQIFSKHFPEGATALILTFTAVGTWNFLSVFISFILVDRLPRKTLLLITLSLMTLSALVLGFVDTVAPSISAYVSVLAIMVFIGAFENGTGPLFWVMAVEAFPSNVDRAALSFTNATVWICNIMLSFCFPLVTARIHQDATFALLSAIAAVATLLIFWFVPSSGSGGGKGGGVGDDDDLLINDSSFRDLGDDEEEEEEEEDEREVRGGGRY